MWLLTQHSLGASHDIRHLYILGLVSYVAPFGVRFSTPTTERYHSTYKRQLNDPFLPFCCLSTSYGTIQRDVGEKLVAASLQLGSWDASDREIIGTIEIITKKKYTNRTTRRITWFRRIAISSRSTPNISL